MGYGVYILQLSATGLEATPREARLLLHHVEGELQVPVGI